MSFETELRLTNHAEERMQQRAIHQRDLHVALEIGDFSWSFGDQVYTITDRALRGTPWARCADRLRGLTVVLTTDGFVRTVKWDYRIRRRGQRAA